MGVIYKRPTDVRVTVENTEKKVILYINKKGNISKETTKK